MSWDDEDEVDEADLDEEDLEDGDEDEDDDGPSAVFVGMAFGREGCDECYDVIVRVCEMFDLEPLRAHPDDIVGSHNGDDVIRALMDDADFAILDLTHERPSVAHEIGLVDGEFPREFILLTAKTGTPRFSNIQGRTVHYYSDVGQLERILKRQLRAMIDGWHDLENEDDEQRDEDDD